MNPAERFRQIEEIFQAALDRDSSERMQFVASACATDPDLRAEVASLLRSVRSDLKTAAYAIGSAARDAVESKQPQSGEMVGNYRLIRKIAEGGMGAVYLAERADGLFEGYAAIKFVRTNLLSTPELTGRLLAEQRMMAGLAHPNIARMLDAGVTADGAPYVVMEFVEGVPLDQYCRENKIGLSARLALFQGICSAVAHAHRNLIVHRDIKPNNILIGPDGIPKLLDFGIAKLVGDGAKSEPGLTQQGERLMTPAYASPELLRGEPVTTSVDIFALGIVLYELLGERHPFQREGQQRWELERAICEEDPTAPASSDFGSIALKALAKDPAARYGSVLQLMEDLERCFAGEPVSAARRTPLYRFRRFVTRNRGAVMAAALIVAIVAAGFVSVVREQRRTKQRFDEVRNLATVFLFEFDDAIRNLPGTTAARNTLVKRALTSLETLLRDSESDRSLRLDVASAYHKIAVIQWMEGSPNLGDRAGSEASTKKEIEIREAIAARPPEDAGNATALAGAYGFLSTTIERGNPEVAQSYFVKEGALLKDLAQRFPEDHDAQFYVAQHHALRGLRLHRAGQLRESLADQRTAIELFEHITRNQPDDLETLRFEAWSHVYAGDVLGGGGAELHLKDRAGAMAETQKALEILRRLAERQPSNSVAARDVQAVLLRVAGIDEATGNYPRALAARKSVAIKWDETLEANPKSAESARDAYVAHFALANTLMQAKRLQEAESELHRAQGITVERIKHFQDPKAPLDLANIYHALGEVNEKQGNLQAAISAWKKAIELREPSLKANPEDVRMVWHQAMTSYALALGLEHSHDRAGARAAFAGALNDFTRLKGQMRAEDEGKPADIARHLLALQ